MSNYQKCKIKILNDNLKIQQEFLEIHKNTTKEMIRILNKIADGFNDAFEEWKENSVE